MKRIAVIVGLAISFIVGYGYAQAPVQYQLTEVQRFRLQLDLLDAQKASVLWQIASQKLPEYDAAQKAQKLADVEADQFRKDNGWPSTVKFNNAVGQYYDTKPVEAKK